MAENKKSVVVYKDWIHTFKLLEDDAAGRLIKHFFEYVNDLNPEPGDKITAIAFEPIKQTLMRDLKKWEVSVSNKRDNGRRGNLKKYQNDLYDEVVAGGLTLEKAEEIAKSRKTSQGDSVASLAIAGPADLAVSDSVSDSVSGNNNKAFIADVEKDEIHYRKTLFDLIGEKKISRDTLFKNHAIDLSKRNQIWEDFIKNCIIEVPRFENEKHVWNVFKKFIRENENKYRTKLNRNPI